MKKVTISDIAKLTGYSIKTVSRVINNSPEVKEETRRIIMNAIQQNNFSVNIMAKALKTKQTRTIILFIDRHGGSYWNAWHSYIIKEIIVKFKTRGYKIIISPSSGEGVIDDETDGFILLKSGIADGAILFDNLRNDIRIEYLRNSNIPFVILGKDLDHNDTSFVDLDNYSVGFSGAGYLIDKGHKSLTLLLGFRDFNVNQERSKGFIDCCEKNNVKQKIYFNIDSVEKAYQISKDILANKDHPDAFFISGDEKAPGIYKAVFEAGFSIPSDIAVLGVDNLPSSKFMHPSLSSIDQDVLKFSSEAVNLLIEKIQSENKTNKSIIINPKLIVRESA